MVATEDVKMVIKLQKWFVLGLVYGRNIQSEYTLRYVLLTCAINLLRIRHDGQYIW